MTYLLDTNVLSELPRARPDRRVLRWLKTQETVAMSAVTVEELTYGVAHAPAAQQERLERGLQELLQIPPEILAVDREVAGMADGCARRGSGRGGRPRRPAC